MRCLLPVEILALGLEILASFSLYESGETINLKLGRGEFGASCPTKCLQMANATLVDNQCNLVHGMFRESYHRLVIIMLHLTNYHSPTSVQLQMHR